MAESQPRRELVLLCGLLCDELVWESTAALLEEQAHITIVSFAGCGSIGEMADRALAAAPERFALAGHSMGGRVALEAFRKAPQRVERLALLNTGVHPVSDAEVPGRQRLLRLARDEGMSAVADSWLPPMVGERGRQNAPMMSSLRRMICRYTPDEFGGQIQALLNRPDAEGVLSTIDVPTLLLSSEEDRWSPVSQHEEMRKMVPGGKLVVIDGIGHMSTIEGPDAVARALRDWLTTEE